MYVIAQHNKVNDIYSVERKYKLQELIIKINNSVLQYGHNQTKNDN